MAGNAVSYCFSAMNRCSLYVQVYAPIYYYIPLDACHYHPSRVYYVDVMYKFICVAATNTVCMTSKASWNVVRAYEYRDTVDVLGHCNMSFLLMHALCVKCYL